MQDDLVVAEGVAPLSQAERFIDTFIAPSKTFTDIRRDASWWLPFLFVSIVSLIFAYVVLHKVGLPTLVDGVVHSSSSLEDKLSSAAPADAARIRSAIEWQFKLLYAGPIFVMIFALIPSAILLGTANFVFGGRATFGRMLAVWFYGMLPFAFISILAMVAIYAGMASDSFNIKNTVGTNIGYYLQGGATPKWLVTLLSSVDIFAIWCAVLLTMGVSIVAGIKRSSAAIVVFGWWALWVLIQTGIAAVS
jgi:hypothetical protein